MMKILAKPASIAAQAITVTAQPRIPTLKPTKSPKAAFEYCMAPPFLSKYPAVSARQADSSMTRIATPNMTAREAGPKPA